MVEYTKRVEDRTNAMLHARLRADCGESDACVVNISSRGLGASSANPPERGEFVELVVGKHSLVGQVRWRSARRFGMAFRQRISVIALLAQDENSAALSPRSKPLTRQSIARAAEASENSGRSIEFIVFAVLAAVATLVVSHYVGSALHSLTRIEGTLGSP